MENNLPMVNALLRAQLKISILSQEEDSKKKFIGKSLQILIETEVVRDAFFRSSKTLHSLYNHEVPKYTSLKSIMSNQGDSGKLPGEDDLYILKLGNEPGRPTYQTGVF